MRFKLDREEPGQRELKNQCILSTNEEKKKRERKSIEIRAPGEVSWENKRWEFEYGILQIRIMESHALGMLRPQV